MLALSYPGYVDANAQPEPWRMATAVDIDFVNVRL